jgi:type IV secretory pathway component VirB8
MGFEEFFENNQNYHGNYRRQGFHSDHKDTHQSRPSSYDKESHFDWMIFLAKIRSNKKLKVLAILASILIIAIVIFLVIALLPLLGKIFTFITQLDLKGLQAFIIGLLDKMFKG